MILISLALFAAAPQVAPVAADPPKKEKKEARTCRRLGTTGSRMDDQRVCKTKSEWARIDAANNAYGVDRSYTGEEERNRPR